MEQKEMLSPLNCIWDTTHAPGAPQLWIIIWFLTSHFIHSLPSLYIIFIPLYHCYLYIFMYCISETAFMFTCEVFHLK